MAVSLLLSGNTELNRWEGDRQFTIKGYCKITSIRLKGLANKFAAI